MDRYEQHNYRDNNSGRDYENRNNSRNEHGEHKLSNYLSRYQEGGNYYGMPNSDHEYRNVRVSRGENSGNNSSGPSQRSSSNYSAYDGSNDNNSYGSSNRSGSRQNDSYGSGNSQSNRGGSNQNDRYHYGDPNSHMNYNRNGGYERTRGTGWRSESDDSRRGSSDYSRQDNSYQQDGSGKRYSHFGRDERNNFGHNNEQLTDIHTDRGEHNRHRSDNDYGNQEYRRNKKDDDNYATGMYSSNRAYLADQGQDRDENMFDHTSDDYPNRSPRGYGQKSGPDWSADSPISRGQHRGADRG